jgi:two-component sensor histidine kinase
MPFHSVILGYSGELHIELYSASKPECRLIVSDTGIGLPADLDFRNPKSLGLQLVNALTHQLGGTIELNRNRGTEFKINFPN